MAIQISAGIVTQEIDLTTVVPAVATTDGGIAGVFSWGPIGKVILIGSEDILAAKFGKPSNLNPETWFTAANFLAYGNSLRVVRAANVGSVLSAIANTGAVANLAAQTVINKDAYAIVSPTFDANVAYVAHYAGALGNSLKVSTCSSATQYKGVFALRTIGGNTSFDNANTKITLAVGSNTANVVISNTAVLTGNTPLAQATAIAALFTVGDYLQIGNTSIGYQNIKITSIGIPNVVNTAGTNTGVAFLNLGLAGFNKLSTDYTDNTATRYWEFYNTVGSAPGQSAYVAASGNTAAQDEIHVVVSDVGGKFSGNAGTILEAFPAMSRATDAKGADGTSIFYQTVINNTSKYIWTASARVGEASNTALNVASSTNAFPQTLLFNSGADGDNESVISIGNLAQAYDLFKPTETVSVSLLMQGKARGGVNGEQLANYIIDNITEYRKDCIVFVSPDITDTVNNNDGQVGQDVVNFFNGVRSTSYAVFDSGHKYQYDKYNDIYRWIPLNGDIAGLCVNTDQVRDPWFSPAGFNRGFIKNVVKLAFNPTQTDRDLLYPNRVNPVVTFSGTGTVLYGDKTALTKPSAFDRINVRRLFIVLEKAVTLATQASLFEFNDQFTRAAFKNIIEPYLRDIQGRRGITAFLVVCDETNNTPEVIDSNRFVGSIYIQPARSISFIQLNFIAVGTGVTFSTVTGLV